MNTIIILVKHHKPSIDWITGKWNINPGTISFELNNTEKELQLSEEVKTKLIESTILNPNIAGEYDNLNHTIIYKVLLNEQYKIEQSEWKIEVSLLLPQLV